MDLGGLTLWHILIFVAAQIGYCLPWLVASARRHPHTLAIGALTLLLGWTLAGWLVALAWAVFGARRRRARMYGALD